MLWPFSTIRPSCLCFWGKRENKVLPQIKASAISARSGTPGMMPRLTRSSTRRACGRSSKRCSQEGVALARQNTWAGHRGAVRLLQLLLVRYRKAKKQSQAPDENSCSWLLKHHDGLHERASRCVCIMFRSCLWWPLLPNVCCVRLFSRSAR